MLMGQWKKFRRDATTKDLEEELGVRVVRGAGIARVSGEQHGLSYWGRVRVNFPDSVFLEWK